MAYLHGAEVWTTHRAELSADIVGGLIVFQRFLRVQAEIELVLPTEFVTSLTQCVVSHRSTGMLLSEVGGMSSKLERYDTCTHIFLVGKRKVLRSEPHRWQR